MLDLAVLVRYAPALLSGFLYTLVTWLAGVAIGMALGLVIAVAVRAIAWRPFRALVRIYIELIRGTPFLIQLFVLYYGGPFVGLTLDALPAGIVGLGVYGSPYFAETFRAGFAAVPRGQVEAGLMAGLVQAAILRRIILPQMLVAILPAIVNLVIILSKETAVLSIITVPELTMQVTAMGTETFAFVPTTLALAVLYWVLVEATAWAGRRAEARVGRHLAA